MWLPDLEPRSALEVAGSFTMSNLTFVAANITIALTVLAVIAVAAAALRPALAPSEQPLPLATALALSAGGFALILFVFLAAGWIGWRLWWVVAALVHLGTAAAIVLTTRRAASLQLRISPEWRRAAPALGFLVWMIAFDSLKCFEPQFEADALWYHLTLPNFWLNAGGLRAHPGLTVAGYPLLIEMIYTAPISYGLPYATRLIHLAFGVGIVVAIYGWLRRGTGVSPVIPGQDGQATFPDRRLTPAASLAFATIFFVFDSVNEVAAWAHTDLARAFFLVCAATALAAYLDRNDRRHLVVTAVLSGLAMSTHYMAVVFGNGLLTVALIVTRVRRRQTRARQIAAELAIFWLVSTATFAPWLLKNIVHYGRPFYGLAGTSFRVPTGAIIGGFFLGNVFFVGCAALAVWFLARRPSAPGERLLAAYLLAYLVVGAFELPPIPRFFLPVYAVGLMLAGRAVAPFLSGRRSLEVVLGFALLAFGIATTCYQWRQHLYDAPLDFVFHNSPRAATIQWHL